MQEFNIIVRDFFCKIAQARTFSHNHVNANIFVAAVVKVRKSSRKKTNKKKWKKLHKLRNKKKYKKFSWWRWNRWSTRNVIQLWIITIPFHHHCHVVCHPLGISMQSPSKRTRLGEFHYRLWYLYLTCYQPITVTFNHTFLIVHVLLSYQQLTFNMVNAHYEHPVTIKTHFLRPLLHLHLLPNTIFTIWPRKGFCLRKFHYEGVFIRLRQVISGPFHLFVSVCVKNPLIRCVLIVREKVQILKKEVEGWTHLKDSRCDF